MKRSCNTCEWWEHDGPEPLTGTCDPDYRICHGSPDATWTPPRWWCATWRMAERLAQDPEFQTARSG